jgi:hypothetical protein
MTNPQPKIPKNVCSISVVETLLHLKIEDEGMMLSQSIEELVFFPRTAQVLDNDGMMRGRGSDWCRW